VYNKKVKICVPNHIVIVSIKHRGNREFEGSVRVDHNQQCVTT
jgi:hypothetical protein